MGQISKKWLFAIPLVCALVILGAVYLWAPVCTGLLELKNGNMVPMKCAHAAKLFVALSVVGGLCALAGLVSKRVNKGLALVVLAAGVLLIVNTFASAVGIGICVSPTMACHTTALWVRVCGAVMGLAGLVLLFVGDSGRKLPD